MKTTAFVSHPDCSRHDTGWKHPEHQGRLPALVRAVYQDMLTLHDHLIEVEGQSATEDDLLLVHTRRHLRGVAEVVARASAGGQPLPLIDDTVVSGASWDAALAAAGCVLTGVDTVLAGEARNAFCAVRPPGGGAEVERAGDFALFNNIAIAARHLHRRRGVERVLIVEWGAKPSRGTAAIFEDDPVVRFLSLHEQSGSSALTGPGVTGVSLPPGSRGELFRSAFEAGLRETVADFRPDFILLAAGFDALAEDRIGGLLLDPLDFYHLTAHLRRAADSICNGHLVSVLEGGYAAAETGRAVVQHLRAMAGVPPRGETMLPAQASGG